MEQLRLGILGYADIVRRRILPALSESKQVVLSGIATRRDPEEYPEIQLLSETPRFYRGYEALLADPAIDAVYIPLPNSLHVEWAIRAMEAGKHVLCEKPMALSLAETKRLFSVADTNHVQLCEAFACMQSPLFPVLRDMITQGYIGDLTVMNAFFHYYKPGWESTIVAKPELGGGAFNDVGCYHVLTFCELLERAPSDAYGVLEIGKTGVDELVIATLDFDGPVGVLQSSIRSIRNTGITLLGNKGYVHFDQTPNAWGDISVYFTGEKGTGEIKLCVPNNYAAELDAFSRTVTEHAPFAMSREKSLRNAAVMELIRSSLVLKTE